MKIILYGEYNNEVKENVNAQYIEAWIMERGIDEDPCMNFACTKISIEALNDMEYDYVLITGDNLSNKFLTLLKKGVNAWQIRTIQDISCIRYEAINQNIYYNELCMDNLENSNKIQVLMVSHDLSESGAPVAFLNMAYCLQEMGYGVKMYCQCSGPMLESFLKKGIPVYIEDLTNRNNLENWLHWNNFKFVVVNTILQYKLVQRISQAQVNVIWWIHECENYYNAILEEEGKFPEMGQSVFPVFVSNKVEEGFYRYVGNHLRGTELLYGLPERTYIKKTHLKSKIVFALIGAVQYRKGQDIFIDAINRLKREERKKCTFKIIGESAQDNNSMMQYIQRAEHNIEEIEYVGKLSYKEMQKEYEKIDVVVCPSRIDPMPVVVTEGLMYYKICLISDEIGTAKYIKNGVNGFVFKTGNVRDLADKVRYIISNWGSLDEISSKGREIYDEYFTIDKFNINVENLVKKVSEEDK